MMSERKAFRLTWFARIIMIFGILGLLFGGYMSIFVNPDMMQSCATITVALFLSMLFFSTFPGYRIDTRFNQIKTKLSERTGFDDTLSAGASMKNDVRQLIIFTIKVTIYVVFVIVNILLLNRAYSNAVLSKKIVISLAL